MSEKHKIHFKNEPFMAVVEDRGSESIQCTPVIFDSFSNCGVGVFYEDGKGQVWGMVTPRNLIAAWRATEVLRLLDHIGHGTLCGAYYTGLRNPHETDMDSHVKPMIAKIGQGAYDEIMSKLVPQEVIQAMLDNQEDDFPPDLYPITDEVRAGTIQWRQEFADAGIKHPEEVDAKEKMDKEMVSRFENLLVSYARSQKMDRDCLGMGHVEGALLTLVSKGVNKTNPDHVLVALAGVVGELSISDFSMFLMPFGPRSQAEYDEQMDQTKERAIRKGAKWLASVSAPWWSYFLFWREKPEVFDKRRAMIRLTALLEEHFPKSTEKLEPAGT